MKRRSDVKTVIRRATKDTEVTAAGTWLTRDDGLGVEEVGLLSRWLSLSGPMKELAEMYKRTIH